MAERDQFAAPGPDLPLVFCVLHDARVSFVSSTAQEVSGISPERFHGQLAMDLVHPDDRPRIAPFFEAEWSGAFEESVRLQDADGGWTWRRVNGVRTIDAGGRPSAALTVKKTRMPDADS